METLRSWLVNLTPSQTVLDLGCGPGSFDSGLYGSARVIGLDSDPKALAQSTCHQNVCASAGRLPFQDGAFDLVICHNSLEHFANVPNILKEIRRVLKTDGRLFVSVPSGASLSDRLYRLLLAGGGHVQRFSFESIVDAIETETGLHLCAWTELFSSFHYLDRRNFLPAPRGRLPLPFPRRMRWLGRLPGCMFSTMKVFLFVACRLVDRILHSRFSCYGWALAFDVVPQQPTPEPGLLNVCMSCGRGSSRNELAPIGWFFYRCPTCNSVNPLFRGGPNQ